MRNNKIRRNDRQSKNFIKNFSFYLTLNGFGVRRSFFSHSCDEFAATVTVDHVTHVTSSSRDVMPQLRRNKYKKITINAKKNSGRRKLSFVGSPVRPWHERARLTFGVRQEHKRLPPTSRRTGEVNFWKENGKSCCEGEGEMPAEILFCSKRRNSFANI